MYVEEEEVLVRTVIYAVVAKHRIFEKLTHHSSEIWQEIFVKTFGKRPTSNIDPLWDELLHNKKGLGGLTILSEYEKKYYEKRKEKKREARAAEYQRKLAKMMNL